jgi:thiamine-phosphate pyrophosphorylase
MTVDLRQAAGLYLVTPPTIDLSLFPAMLEAALSVDKVDAVLVAALPAESDMVRAAQALVPIIQSHGAAALIENDGDVANRTKADGVHVTNGIGALRTAIERFRPQRIVGAGGVSDRHSAMQAGEANADYVFFGRPHGDIRPEPHPKNVALAEWWSAIFEIPAVIMAGNDIGSVADAAATGAEFVALQSACWEYEDGPAAAIAHAHQLIANTQTG